MSNSRFTDELNDWLSAEGPHTLADLGEVMGDRFAVMAILLLMLPAALPLPTGGVTHVAEVISALLCVRLIFGRSHARLPKRWRDHEVGQRSRAGLLRTMRAVALLERFSRPRMSSMMKTSTARRITAVLMLTFTVTAFIAPPFSGLDTLPALGVVVLCMSRLVYDALYAFIGVALGCAGIVLIAVLAGTAYRQLMP